MNYTRKQLKPVAEAIANNRFMRNGSVPFTNPLTVLESMGSKADRLIDEVYEDAESAVKAWEEANK